MTTASDRTELKISRETDNLPQPLNAVVPYSPYGRSIRAIVRFFFDDDVERPFRFRVKSARTSLPSRQKVLSWTDSTTPLAFPSRRRSHGDDDVARRDPSAEYKTVGLRGAPRVYQIRRSTKIKTKENPFNYVRRVCYRTL